MSKDGRSEGAERLSALNEDVPDALRPANLGLSSVDEDPDAARETGEATLDGAEPPEAEPPLGPGPDLDPDNTD
jgi:hypothetical protein